ncbi:LOW QUALITY PROTEIN: insulin-like peptide INSL5 [Salvelinus alpinus]
MRALPVLLPLLMCVVVGLSQVRVEVKAVKLCGEFLRAVVYTCGGSRFRQLLNEPEQLEGELSISTFYFKPSLLPPISISSYLNFFTLNLAYRPFNSDSHYDLSFLLCDVMCRFGNEEKSPISLEDLKASLWSEFSRRDLNNMLTTVCYQVGCRKSDLTHLC